MTWEITYDEMCKQWEPGGDIVPACTARTYRIAEPLRVFLAAHGCKIEPGDRKEDMLLYPQGTTRQQLYPVTTDMRYRVLLSDNIELLEVVHGRGQKEPVLLSVVLDKNSTPELEKILSDMEARGELDSRFQQEIKRIREMQGQEIGFTGGP